MERCGRVPPTESMWRKTRSVTLLPLSCHGRDKAGHDGDRLGAHMVRTIIATAIAVTLGASAAAAQDWPSKPVRIITGFAAGGIGDLGARLLADHTTRTTGQQAVVENRTGAAGPL